jgi:trehalose synthase
MYRASGVEVPRRPVAALEDVIGLERTARLLAAAADFRKIFGNRTIWNFSSTVVGGGVAEMLQVLVGYTKDLAVDIRWSMIEGDGEFFRITKRVHNRIHGDRGDGGSLGAAEFDHVRDVMNANADSVRDDISPGDIVLLHDPQTAGLAQPCARRGAHVVWRSHIGVDESNELSDSAWQFLRPFLAAADAHVFSRASYVPPVVPVSRAWIIPPSIDPFSPKNQPMDSRSVHAALAQIGLFRSGPVGAVCRYTRRDGSPGDVHQPGSVVAEALPEPEDPVVLQVSRWDRLKDMLGVMRGFAEHVAPDGPGWLALVGPSVDGVTDDPEGALVFAETLAAWQKLAPATRSRVIP